MLKHFFRSKIILLKVLPFVAAIILLKYVLHRFNLEFLTMNAIYSGIIGANIFLLGFLLSGVLSDFKESEKLPGDIASQLNVCLDELTAVRGRHKKQADRGIDIIYRLSLDLKGWFYKKVSTRDLMVSIRGMNELSDIMEKSTHIAFVPRVKAAQAELRRIMIRINTIRETDFISSGYLIASSTSLLLILAMVVSKIDPFYESLFLVGVIAYLLIFLLFLIHDLDNPFGHYEKMTSEDVSLHPVDDLIRDIEELRSK